jgi:hypothetical protein
MVKQQATMEEALFSMGATLMQYKEGLTQLELKLSSGVGSCSRGL